MKSHRYTWTLAEPTKPQLEYHKFTLKCKRCNAKKVINKTKIQEQIISKTETK